MVRGQRSERDGPRRLQEEQNTILRDQLREQRQLRKDYEDEQRLRQLDGLGGSRRPC